VVSAATGAVVDPGRGFLRSTGFVLDPEGRVVVSVYSTGAIGRLLPDDVKGLVRPPVPGRLPTPRPTPGTAPSTRAPPDPLLHPTPCCTQREVLQ
jgi:hypothetical protein